MFRFAVLVAGARAWSDPSDVKPLCAETHTAYVTAEKVSSGPNGGWVLNALSCQESCALDPYCKRFTWKRDTTPTKGGCWHVSDADAVASEDPQATSGPRTCGAAPKPVSLSGSVIGPVSISDARAGAMRTNAKEFDGDVLGSKPVEKKTLAASSGPNDGKTFIFGLVSILGVAGAIFGIAGASYWLLGKRPRNTRSVKANDEEQPMIAEAATPSTLSLPELPKSAPDSAATSPTVDMVGPMPQLQLIQYYQPLHVLPPQQSGQP